MILSCRQDSVWQCLATYTHTQRERDSDTQMLLNALLSQLSLEWVKNASLSHHFIAVTVLVRKAWVWYSDKRLSTMTKEWVQWQTSLCACCFPYWPTAGSFHDSYLVWFSRNFVTLWTVRCSQLTRMCCWRLRRT